MWSTTSCNEYIAIDQLINVTKIYAQDIYELAK